MPHNLYSFTISSALDKIKINACFHEDAAVVSKKVAGADLFHVVLFVVSFQDLFFPLAFS